jgi:hypothetical protein
MDVSTVFETLGDMEVLTGPGLRGAKKHPEKHEVSGHDFSRAAKPHD